MKALVLLVVACAMAQAQEGRTGGNRIAPDGGIAPANANASPASRKVLTYLASLARRPDARVLSGQNVGHGAGCAEGQQRFATTCSGDHP
jgi:hypothetical protein